MTWAPGSPLYLIEGPNGWLAALTQASGSLQSPPGHPIIHTQGPQAAAQNTSTERYEWEPLGFADQQVNFVRSDPTNTIGDTEGTGNSGGFAARFNVTLVAADFGAVMRLYLLLRVCVDLLFGPPQGGDGAGGGYVFGVSSNPMRGGVPNASAWSCVVPIDLTDSVPRRVFKPVLITSATSQLDAADANGAEQAIPVLLGAP